MDDLRDTLRHVLWIGGPPDAGKSTVADLLGGKHGLSVYHFDRHEMDHIARADPVRSPQLYALRVQLAELDEGVWLEEFWVRRSAQEMTLGTIASWSERVGLAVEDILAMPMDRPLIAEGAGFFPEVILPLLSTPCQAIFLAPSEAFKRASHERRAKSERRDRTSDPERFLRNHIERDLLMAAHYRRAASELGLTLIDVDGSRAVEQVAAAVEAHFEPLLAGPRTARE
jgi:2-phosphoglycerate kinase